MWWALLALGVGLQNPPDPSSATLLEQAVVEQRCGWMRTITSQETEAHEQCLRSELASLRSDFGRDLGRLLPADRRTIDAVCSKIDRSVMREAYVKCLSDQLTTVHNRRTRASPAPAAPVEPPADATPAAAPAAPAITFHPQSSEYFIGWWIGGGALAIFVIAGGAFFLVKSRRPVHTCRTCGEVVSDAGALCQKCRHAAAEALRTAAHERAEHERAEADARRRQREEEEEQARARAQRAEAARLQQEEDARLEAARREEDARLEAEARRRRETGAPQADETSPYAVLGVAEGASADAVRAAYDEAVKKYDPTLVADMGMELQDHFRAKAEAVERAYQQITAGQA
jgi:DnaJ-domain-containing protein 1